MPTATKLSRGVTYHVVVPTKTSRDPSITWLYKIT